MAEILDGDERPELLGNVVVLGSAWSKKLVVEADGFIPSSCVGCGAYYDHSALSDAQQAIEHGLSSGWEYKKDGPKGPGNYCDECLEGVAEEDEA